MISYSIIRYSPECKTISGDQANKTCIFPFIYGEIVYNECTTTENDGIPWCSTKTDVNNNTIKDNWGNCAEQCPVEHISGSSRFLA